MCDGVVVNVDLQVLVVLIYGSLEEVVFWIVDGEVLVVWLLQVGIVFDLLLCGLCVDIYVGIVQFVQNSVWVLFLSLYLNVVGLWY